MERDRKKVAAAAITVMRYLEAEQELREASSAAVGAGPGVESTGVATPAGAFWAASGRLTAMQIRNLMQLRMLRKS